jgi:SAM-dependent methyltransferase
MRRITGRGQAERELAPQGGPHPVCEDGTVHPGLCNICGGVAGFCQSPASAPREGYHCLDCGSTSRDRMLIRTLGLCLGLSGPLESWAEQPLTLIETSGYRGTPPRLAAKFRYMNLMFASYGVENCVQGDLSRLCFRDETIDVLLTSDVFEHVREDEPAWREVFRVLKPGGYMLLQAPALGEFETTQVRVEVRDGEDVHLMEPEYHAEMTLVYRNYGRDLLEKLRGLGFAVLEIRARYPEHCISEQTIIIAQKAPYLSVGPLEISDRVWT